MNDREKLIEILDANWGYEPEGLADRLIANGVVIQKHGCWIHHNGAVVCSECEVACSLMYDYCPSCGAVMDLED